MKIAIDLRSLSSGSISGVENYVVNLLAVLLPRDKQNSYTLFYNSFKQEYIGEFDYVNARLVHTKYPNKILNAGLKFKFITLERIIGEFDWLFMPNLNQYNISPKVKLALTVHDLSPVIAPEFYDTKRRLWHNFLNYKKAFERANVIFAVSEYTKTDLQRVFNVPESKIKVVYPGLDHKQFHAGVPTEKVRQARNLYGLPGEYVLFLNTTEPRKNLENVLKAFEAWNSSAYLVIVGKPGWKYKQIVRALKQSKKSAKIKYIGYVEEDHKPALIKLSSALIYPSFYEGFGFQPLEAMALGVPVIASSVTAVPEVVQDAGLLVNPYDISEIAAALGQITKNEQLRKNLTEKGIARASQFSWEITAENILKNFS